ncbi:MAG TPA: UxaA family hydrolase [bacterium]|nr:UxaA family hydrolase [bacterium]
MGYKRPDGSAGVRNHVLVMSTVSCANGVVNAVARAVPEVKAITHTEGCGRGIADIRISSRTLAGLARNPNVAAVLVVGLGCEFIKAQSVADAAAAIGKPVAKLVIQDTGGSRKTAAAGIEIVKKFLAEAAAQKREECGWEKLTVGLECGGSDALSGVTANPLVGTAADWLVGQGATVILAEITEMIGTEHILSRRAATPELADKIVSLIQAQRRKTEEILGPLAGMVISPGNIEGGLSNITEKSLGCVIKGGTTPIVEIADYAAAPVKKGLVIMDTPGSDIFSLTGMAAGGAQLIIFTTGRGTPAGFPIAPVIKIASNSELFRSMGDDMDQNAGTLLEGVSLGEARDELIALIRRTVSGDPVKAELNLQEVLSIHTVGPAF